MYCFQLLIKILNFVRMCLKCVKMVLALDFECSKESINFTMVFNFYFIWKPFLRKKFYNKQIFISKFVLNCGYFHNVIF